MRRKAPPRSAASGESSASMPAKTTSRFCATWGSAIVKWAVALSGGGRDAIRARARGYQKEIIGLELTKIQSTGIERANDQIGRLGLITQSRRATAWHCLLCPARASCRGAPQNSLREGGRLRAMIDGLVREPRSAFDLCRGCGRGFWGQNTWAQWRLAALFDGELVQALMFLRGGLDPDGDRQRWWSVPAEPGLVGFRAPGEKPRAAGANAPVGAWGISRPAFGKVSRTSASADLPPANWGAGLENVRHPRAFYGMMSGCRKAGRVSSQLGADLSDIPGMGKFADAILETSGARLAAGMSRILNAKGAGCGNSEVGIEGRGIVRLAAEGSASKDAAAKLARDP